MSHLWEGSTCNWAIRAHLGCLPAASAAPLRHQYSSIFILWTVIKPVNTWTVSTQHALKGSGFPRKAWQLRMMLFYLLWSELLCIIHYSQMEAYFILKEESLLDFSCCNSHGNLFNLQTRIYLTFSLWVFIKTFFSESKSSWQFMTLPCNQ